MLCLRGADQKQGALADTTEAEGGERLRHDAVTPAPKGEKTKILFKLPFCSIRVLKGERWVTASLLLKDAAFGLGLRPSVLPSCAATASS